MKGIRVWVLSVTIPAAAVAGCSETTPAPTQVPQIQVPSRIEISGPGEVGPGGSAQFRAVARHADGSSQEVTAEADWWSSNLSVLTVAAGGRATGHGTGETTVYARFASRIGSVEVIGVPTGTFRLKVAVFASGGERLSTAHVEVLGPDGAELPSASSGNERRFYGARGRTEVRTSLPALFESDVQTIDIQAHQDLKISLKPLGRPVVDVTGSYTLTITASASCAALLPDEARMRTYAASAVQQYIGRVVVSLAGARFEGVGVVPGNSIEGEVVSASQARFALADKEGAGWGDTSYVRESLAVPDGTYEPAGNVSVFIDERGLSGHLDGTISFLPRQSNRSVRCTAKDHSFVMSRR